MASGTDEISFRVAQPGAYRAEVRIVPNHVKGWLGGQEASLLHEYLWVYSNPIYVE